LPLLFAKNKDPASKVRVSATGILNGGVAISEDEGAMSSSAIAVASPSGMLLEQQPKNAVSVSEPEVQPTVESNAREPVVEEKKTVPSSVSLYNQTVVYFLISFSGNTRASTKHKTCFSLKKFRVFQSILKSMAAILCNFR